MDEGRNFPLPATQGWAWENQIQPARAGANGGTTGGGKTFVTIATADRAAQSRVLARSARENHPDARLVVLVPDAIVPPAVFADSYDLVLSAEELSLGGLADMRFRYSPDELCLALTPWVIRHLLDRFDLDRIYYLDSDIELFSPLIEAEAALAHGANIVLVPQILQPFDQNRDMAALQSGSFNAGFVAIAPSAQARAFVAWWCERVRTGCTRDPINGPYGCGTWLELASSICDGVAILRHPGYNLGLWNAYERPLTSLGGAWSVAGYPLRFVHYSQWNLREQDTEQYLARHFPPGHQPIADLFAEYRQKVQGEGLACGEHQHDGAADLRTPQGNAVPEVVRHAYARHAPATDGDAGAVFARAVSVLGAPSKTSAELLDLPLSILCDEIWQHHSDLRYRFDVCCESDRLAYLRWLVEEGAAELGIPGVFLKQARAAVDRRRIHELESAEGAQEMPRSANVEPSAQLPLASADAVASLIAARDAERDQTRRQQSDIRLLVGSNKSLRREALALRVQRWRDDETIQRLEAELAQTREALAQRNRELAAVPLWLRRPFTDGLRGPPGPSPAEPGRRDILEGDGPFFKRGFVVGETAAVGDTSVKRIKDAPSGMMIFGPYVNLPAGRYAVTIDAWLYQRLPLLADFKVDVVCNGAQRVVEARRFRLHSLARSQRFEVVFSVRDGEDYPDFEIRLWARRRTPLEVGRIGLYELTDKPAATA